LPVHVEDHGHQNVVAGDPDRVDDTTLAEADDYQGWLDPGNEDVSDLLALTPADGWIAYPVNRRVDDPKNDDAKLIEPELA